MNIYTSLKILPASISLIIIFSSCNEVYKSTQLNDQNFTYEDKALRQELSYSIGLEILRIQKKYNLSPDEPILVEKGSKEEKEMARLCELIQTLYNWEEEPYITGSESDDIKIRSMIFNLSGPTMNLFFLEHDRAIAFTGAIKKIDHDIIFEKGSGKLYYLIKHETKWDIIYIRDWYFLTIQ